MLQHMTFKHAALLALFALLVAMPWFGGLFYTGLFTRVIILAIAATSLNLILGFGGMVSFGHAAFIGIGAYCVGIPAYYDNYNGFTHLLIAIAASAAYGLVTGAISLRTKGVHFIMITMAFAQMVFFAFLSLEEYGGDDGLVINSRSDFGLLGSLESNMGLYYTALVVLLLFTFIVHRMVNSRFGMVIQGARMNERRMQAIGYNTYLYRLAAYVISGVMCGIAGALLGNFTNFISPDMMGWTRSGELIFMVILGGTGALFGPVMGAAAFLLAEHYLSSLWVYWQLIFGLALILVVLYVRGGIDGILSWRRAGDE